MDRWTKKLMTRHKALHPRNNIHRLYVSRKQGGRSCPSIEDCVDASTQSLEEYINKSKERPFIATSNSNINIRTNLKKQQNLENRKKKNNSMDMSSAKIAFDMDMTKTGKRQETNWISFNSSIKQCFKGQLY